jgi:hypothetical protein
MEVSLKSDNNNGALHEEQRTFLLISRSVILIVRNVSDKICREIKNTHFVSQYLFFENRAVYEIIWENNL